MMEIVERLLGEDGAIAEYSGKEASIFVEGRVKKEDPLGRVENITAKVKIHIKGTYNESTIPSGIQTFSVIEGKISELTIYYAVLKYILKERQMIEELWDCLRGGSIEGYRKLPICDIHVEKLEDTAKKESFEAVIKGVQFIIVIPSIIDTSKQKGERNYTLNNVVFVAKDIERRETPSALKYP